MLARKPAAIILSGGPSSVYAEGAPAIDPAVFTAGVPVFGMCYGFQLMAQGLGGEVSPHRRPRVRPYAGQGRPRRHPARRPPGRAQGLDVARRLRDRGARRASTCSPRPRVTPVAAFEDVDRRLAGVQWHPEVLHTEHGQQVLEHFLHDIAGCRPTWTMVNIVEEQVERIREQIGDARAICALSGGVDSAVAAADRAARDRRPAHLRLRRPRDDAAGRDRAGTTRLRGRLRHPRRGRRVRPVPRCPRGGRRPGGEAEDHRPGVHPGLRGGRGAGLRRRRVRRARRTSCRARSTPTSSSPAAERAPPTSSPTTTSAASPTT